jgi:hypothetical protein
MIRPRFNPNDGDELLFWSRDQHEERALFTYRISTGVLTEVPFGSHTPNAPFADWGSNGWILLTLKAINEYEHYAYKVKPNGDSLTQVSPVAYVSRPQWSPSAEHFGFQHSSGFIVVDAATLEHRTLVNDLPAGSSWYAEEHVAGLRTEGVQDLDLANDQVDLACTWSLGNEETAFESVVLPDHEHIVCIPRGVRRTHMTTCETQPILPNCSSRSPIGVDYAPQTGKLLLAWMVRTPIGDTELVITYELTVMDLDGTHQEVLPIVLPE